MGTPRASPTSTTKPATPTGGPSELMGPVQPLGLGTGAATWARPRAMASPPNTTRLSTTSTRARGALRQHPEGQMGGLGEDLGGEGLVAQDLEGPVLGQDHECYQ